MKSFTVLIGKGEYRVQRSPEPLVDADGRRVASLTDMEQRIIWICPDLEIEELPEIVAVAVSATWQEKFRVRLVS